jgi:Zn-dependent protease with chaperone function
MVVSTIFSRFLLRQQEFHADLHEIRLGGSETFIRTMKQIHFVGAAQQVVSADLMERLPSGNLPDSFPRLLQSALAHLPSKAREHIEQEVMNGKTGILDTHPSSQERIQQAERANEPGVFQLERPAATLLSDYPSTARNVTFDVYRGLFGPKFNRDCLIDTEKLLAGK